MPLTEAELNELMILSGRAVLYCSFLPIVVGFLKRKLFSKSVRIFYLYLLIDFCIAFLMSSFIWAVRRYRDVFVPILEKCSIETTDFFGILYHVNVVGVLGWYFSTVIPNAKLAGHVRRISYVLVAAMLINYFFIEGFRVYGVFNPTVAAICGFIFPLLHLWFLFRQNYQLDLTRNPYFWFALGLVFSMLLGFFKTFTGNQLSNTDFALFAKFTIANNLLIIVSLLLFCLGFTRLHNLEYLR